MNIFIIFVKSFGMNSCNLRVTITDLPTKIKYVITKIKNLGCGAGPLGPHLGQSLGKAPSI